MSSDSPMKMPSLWRIIQTDYAIFVTLFIPILFWAFFFVTRMLIPEGIWLAIAVSVVCLVPFIRRLVTIYWLFRHGTPVEGQVEIIRFKKDRGWLEAGFTLDGKNYRKSCAIFQAEQTQNLYVGGSVTLLVDPGKPDRAVVKDLFD